jgi:hypothetical protein
MIKRATTFFRVAIIGCCLATLATGTSAAASTAPPQGTLGISPTSVDTVIKPGSSASGNELVLNQGKAPFQYLVYVTPYDVEGEDYTPYFTPIPGSPDVTSWFKITARTKGQINPGEQIPIPYTITIPKNTPAGSYYATILAEKDTQGSNGIVTRVRVGTIFYIRVAGPAVTRGNVALWSVPWLQHYPLTATLKLANTGSVYFLAQVNVSVKDIFGGSKYTFSRNPAILPQKLRRIPVPWQNGAHFGLYKVSGSASFNGQNHSLPTRYVLVASPKMRLVGLGIFLLFLVALIVVGKKSVSKKYTPRRR